MDQMTDGWACLSSGTQRLLFREPPWHDIHALCVCDGAEKVRIGCYTGRTQTPFFEGGTICEKNSLT
jgi:hypothetical protein